MNKLESILEAREYALSQGVEWKDYEYLKLTASSSYCYEPEDFTVRERGK